MDKKLILISIDAFVTEDLEIMRTLPNFSRVLKNASIVKRNLSTYPTLTHSIHTSILTGCNPGRHGVINNEHFQPFNNSPEWFDDARDIQVPTFLDACRDQLGLTTAVVYWPLGMNTNTTWVIHRPGIGGPHGKYENVEQELIDTSTPGIYTGQLYERCRTAWGLPHYYEWDEFGSRAVEQMILLYQPDVMINHMTVIDAERHHHGVFNDRLKHAYEFLDRGLGYILKALDDTGLADKTILAITSDHGHMNHDYTCRPNVLLAENGFLKIDEEGNLLSWDAFCHSSGFGCQVYLQDKSPANVARITRFLLDHQKELHFSEIRDNRLLWDKYGLKGDFSLMFETDNTTCYISDCKGPLLFEPAPEKPGEKHSTHGHSPEKGVQPCFILNDPFRTKEPVILENGRVIDQAPTLMALLGASMPWADGRPREELL